jgi:hypothetical protein
MVIKINNNLLNSNFLFNDDGWYIGKKYAFIVHLVEQSIFIRSSWDGGELICRFYSIIFTESIKRVMCECPVWEKWE